MKKPEKRLLSFIVVALMAFCLGHTGSVFAQNGGPTDASATVTLLEGIDSTRSQPGHQYRAVLDKPISVSGFPIPRGTPAIVVLTQARAGNAAIWTLQLTGFVVGGAPVAVTGTSPTLPKTFGNVLGAVAAGPATGNSSSSSFMQVRGEVGYSLQGCKKVTEILNFTEPSDQQLGAGKVSVVTYTWKYTDIAPWMSDPAVKASESGVEDLLNKPDDDPSHKAQERMILTHQGWRTFDDQ